MHGWRADRCISLCCLYKEGCDTESSRCSFWREMCTGWICTVWFILHLHGQPILVFKLWFNTKHIVLICPTLFYLINLWWSKYGIKPTTSLFGLTKWMHYIPSLIIIYEHGSTVQCSCDPLLYVVVNKFQIWIPEEFWSFVNKLLEYVEYNHSNIAYKSIFPKHPKISALV